MLKALKDKALIILTNILLSAFFCFCLLSNNSIIKYLVSSIDNFSYDFLMLHFNPNQLKDRNVIILDIDEKSVAKYGRWPWSREIIADIVDKLAESGAISVAFDVLFSEPESSPIYTISKKLQAKNIYDAQWQQQLGSVQSLFQADKQLADSMANFNAILAFTFNTLSTQVGSLPPPLLKLDPKLSKSLHLVELPGYTNSLPQFQKAAAGNGFVTVQPDDDGILRRVPLILIKNQQLYGSLSLITAINFLLEDNISLAGSYDKQGNYYLEGINIGKQLIHTNQSGEILIPFHGRRGTIPYYSIADLMNNKIAPVDIENKIVLIGSTLLGLADFQATPVNSIYPGVEVHGNIIEAILSNNLIYYPFWTLAVKVILTVVLGLIASLIYPFLRIKGLSLATTLLISSLLALEYYWWHQQRLFISLLIPAINIFAVYLASLSYGYFIETKSKQRLKSLFSEYVPPEYAEKIAEQGKNIGFDEGEQKDMTVLFSDIEGFTTISEELGAQKTKQLLSYYLTPMTEIIFNHHGTIDKYMGDAIMAFWGAPLDNENHRYDAMLAAIDIIKEVKKRSLATSEYPEVKIKLGLSSGITNVGDMGTIYRRAYTAIGDTVNTAARVESATRMYPGIDALVTESMIKGIDDLLFCPVDKVYFKGKNKPTLIYQLIGKRAEQDEPTKQEALKRAQAFELYLSQDFAQSQKIYQELIDSKAPYQALYAFYLDRVTNYLNHPPANDWQGVYKHTTKK